MGTHLRVGQQPADEIAEWPVGPDPDVGQRRRGDGKQQVGHGEVKQEAVGDGAHLPVSEHSPGNGHVGHDGRGEYNHEHGNLDRGLGLFVAELGVECEKVPGTPSARRVVAHQVRRVEQTHFVFMRCPSVSVAASVLLNYKRIRFRSKTCCSGMVTAVAHL